MYKPGTEIGHADGLSRLPLLEIPQNIPIPGETILLIENLDRTLVDAELILQETSRDPIFSRIRRFLQVGWPLASDKAPSHLLKEELSIEN